MSSRWGCKSTVPLVRMLMLILIRIRILLTEKALEGVLVRGGMRVIGELQHQLGKPNACASMSVSVSASKYKHDAG